MCRRSSCACATPVPRSTPSSSSRRCSAPSSPASWPGGGVASRLRPWHPSSSARRCGGRRARGSRRSSSIFEGLAPCPRERCCGTCSPICARSSRPWRAGSSHAICVSAPLRPAPRRRASARCCGERDASRMSSIPSSPRPPGARSRRHSRRTRPGASKGTNRPRSTRPCCRAVRRGRRTRRCSRRC